MKSPLVAAAITSMPSGPVHETPVYISAQEISVVKRDGSLVPFDRDRIRVAISKAFQAKTGEIRDLGRTADELAQRVEGQLVKRTGRNLNIEEIQDQVEIILMKAGYYEIAREYIVYREERTRLRERRLTSPAEPLPLQVQLRDGSSQDLNWDLVQAALQVACDGLEHVDPKPILEILRKDVYNGMPIDDLRTAQVMAARSLVEGEPGYSYVTARLVLRQLKAEVLPFVCGPDHPIGQDTAAASGRAMYRTYFPLYIHKGIELELLQPNLTDFDLSRLAAALVPERDSNFQFLGLQTLYDRYFLHSGGIRIELPQAFFMRVAMGLAQAEEEPNERAIEFYHLLSSFDFMCSTPTLFNAGTPTPQLSSCFLSTVPDDLDGIFKSIKDNALLSKFSGGLGNDWTPVRGLGSHIKGTNGESQGVIPFLKVANDTAVAVNQCFAPGTKVHTGTGIQNIQDITTKDLVLGQRGEYRQVLETLKYNQTGPMVEVKVKHSVQPLRVTAGHPFWAIKGVPLMQSVDRTTEWISKAKVKPTWVDAGDLQIGDYVAQAIPREVIPISGLSEDDARLYGVLLGDGHCTKDELEWGVSGNPQNDEHLEFVAAYLKARGIHYWVHQRSDLNKQICWSSGRGLMRDESTGQFRSANQITFPLTREDLYDSRGLKRIAPRFRHLPRIHTLALLQGLLETDGGISRGKEIYFTSTSAELAEGVRYQMLRLGVPTGGQYREREQNHEGTRQDGSKIQFNGTVKAYDIRIPAAVPELADRLNCRPLTKRNWLVTRNWIFSRVRAVTPMPPTLSVMDLKVEGDQSYMTTSALVHNGGKRKGAVCAYLETWHMDINEFLDLRKNTGDDRRRTHDMNTACWIPDLFMERVETDDTWTLFSPDEVPDLHELSGQKFRERYLLYETEAAAGRIKLFKSIKAQDLWRRMLTMLFETGHPWITFKDACNVRSPQQHEGVVHSSNLCTEITLNSNAEEVAVCNLGSVNLAQHIHQDAVGGPALDKEKLQRTVRTAIRMLDNVIDLNFYTIPETQRSNMRHRPIGLGLMGFQDALYEMGTPYASSRAVEFADQSMEAISYYAIQASSELARERAPYPTFTGSLWSKGILPIDSLDLLDKARNRQLEVDRNSTMDWSSLRRQVQKDGMRNSNVMAIAPTATIANICGVGPSIEPTFRNLYVKSNMSGDFTVINEHLVRDLKAIDLWDPVMISDLKIHDGSVGPIRRIPVALKQLYATAFEMEPTWLIEAGARRQKWLDQSQSLNLYVTGTSGRALNDLYMLAWKRGLKTTYYLRTQSATQVEKSTLATTDGRLNAVPVAPAPQSLLNIGTAVDPESGLVCNLDDEDCEACQ